MKRYLVLFALFVLSLIQCLLDLQFNPCKAYPNYNWLYADGAQHYL
jgi:hypothetical protein